MNFKVLNKMSDLLFVVSRQLARCLVYALTFNSYSKKMSVLFFKKKIVKIKKVFLFFFSIGILYKTSNPVSQ